MNEPRNRARKVTRKAGPPEPADQQPVFQAPEQAPAAPEASAQQDGNDNRDPVSYTHLTLPTILLV